MIISLANNIAAFIGNKLNSSGDDIELYSYGLQILLGAIIKIIGIVAFAWALNVLPFTLALFITFAAFRCFGGGAHLSSYPKCLTFGICLIVGAGYLSRFYVTGTILEDIFILLFISAVCICVKIVPADTEKKRIDDLESRLHQKIKFSVIAVLWAISGSYLLRIGQNQFALAMILGCLSSLFLITPLGYQLFKLIDKLTD